ncbi:MAG TPA: ACP S-malonyltransferase [Thermomicrobiales bacterium]|nr:[acyl-carrier-protein] S-malonyltransferase [Chloroflexota bacterium]HCG29618.1 [acyl-carrier-protein] S-malonyltransferase [Chloroflexota bacterium]HQZ88556.1 ACP S-malonyltransferase [Thermomicrobiales bacterium]
MSAGVAWVFPGQGSQAVGMGQAVAEADADARAAFAEADAALGFSISRICWDGPEAALTRTSNQQPAIVATSVATLRALHAENLLPEPDYVAGHSLGEYSALVAADALTLPDAIRLVRRRGELMEEHALGSMIAILGLDETALGLVANETGTQIANFNAPGQITLSGSEDAIAVAEIAAKARGARRIVRLPVNGAFHSSLMEPVAEALGHDIDRTAVTKPRVPLVSNVTAEPIVHPDDIRRELVDQICASVQWMRSVETMIELSVTHFYEIGAGSVLSGLIGRINKSVTTVASDRLLASTATRS